MKVLKYFFKRPQSCSANLHEGLRHKLLIILKCPSWTGVFSQITDASVQCISSLQDKNTSSRSFARVICVFFITGPRLLKKFPLLIIHHINIPHKIIMRTIGASNHYFFISASSLHTPLSDLLLGHFHSQKWLLPWSFQDTLRKLLPACFVFLADLPLIQTETLRFLAGCSARLWCFRQALHPQPSLSTFCRRGLSSRKTRC